MSEPGGRAGPVELSAIMSGPSGAPVLVLGNSLGTTRELWEPQLDALGRRFRLLRYEHRGHGGSPAPPGPYAISDLGADVLALLDDFESVPRTTPASRSAAWWACGSPRTRRTGSRHSRCAAPRRACSPRSRGQTGPRRCAARARLDLPAGRRRWFTPPTRPLIQAPWRGSSPAGPGRRPEGYAGCCDAIAPWTCARRSPRSPPRRWSSPGGGPGDPAVARRGHRPRIRGARLRVIRGASHLADVSRRRRPPPCCSATWPVTGPDQG